MLQENPVVLIVDDEKVNLKLLSDLLQHDAQIMLAKNGRQALEKANKHLPDLILLDVVMPDMDGFEVLQALKSKPLTKLIPVIFVSGLTDVQFEEKGIGLGASDYILKPFHDAVVKARVKLHLQLVRQRKMLERLALIDPLTELPNRRKFEEMLNVEWRLALRTKTSLSIGLLNLDGFKRINEQFGYALGDEYLTRVAVALVQQLKRAKDFVGRFSGQEFVFLLPATDDKGAHNVISRCQSGIDSLRIVVDSDSGEYLTACIGGVSIIPEMDDNLTDVTSKVDQLLHQARQSGVNNVCWKVFGK